MTVTLYSTGCPMCMLLEASLHAHNISYTTNTDEDEMQRLGFTSLPMLDVDGQIMTYREAVKWVNQQ